MKSLMMPPFLVLFAGGLMATKEDSYFGRYVKSLLDDPESAAYFANAQAESAKELLRCGIISNLSSGSMEMSKTTYMNWGIK